MKIEQLRQLAIKFAMATSVILTLAVCAVEFYAQGGIQIGAQLAIVCLAALGGAYFTIRQKASFQYAAVSVLMAQVMALVIASKGYAFQTDIHMAFFATLAVCALFYDIRPVILGTLLVAVHHIALGLTLEELLFFGEGTLLRIVVHAVILVAEAVALVWMIINTRKFMNVANEQSSLAEQSAQDSIQASNDRAAEQVQNTQQREKMVTDLREAFGGVVQAASAGDFTRRIDTNFPDDELNMLADSVNELVGTVEKGLADTTEVLSALAEYDLTERMQGDYQGSFLELKTNMNKVADRFSNVVNQIGGTSRALKQATGEILSGSNDLSERTSRQAASIEETSATTEQLAETVRENTERAVQAQASITEARGVAERGGDVMAEANEAMKRITASSSKISDIIGMIDDIAFQTNLLALNASVEAARAGEAGKGFAVVAIEVRRLAQSAAQASSEVKVLIEQSGTEVEGGTKLVSQASENLVGIVESVRGVTALMDDIAKESKEQASSINDITHSIREMDQMTQHNAALVEETNAAIDQTESQASELDVVVEQFKTEKGYSSSTSSRLAKTG